MVKNSSYNKFTNLMINDVIKKLEGTHKDFLRIEAPDKPSKFIVIGTLGDKSKDYTQKPTDTNRTLTTVKNNSLSVKFLLKEKSGNIDIIPSLSVYYRVYPTFEEQLNFIKKNYEEYREKETVDIARIWKRYDITFKKIKIELSKNPKFGKNPYIELEIFEEKAKIFTEKRNKLIEEIKNILKEEFLPEESFNEKSSHQLIFGILFRLSMALDCDRFDTFTIFKSMVDCSNNYYHYYIIDFKESFYTYLYNKSKKDNTYIQTKQDKIFIQSIKSNKVKKDNFQNKLDKKMHNLLTKIAKHKDINTLGKEIIKKQNEMNLIIDSILKTLERIKKYNYNYHNKNI